MNSAGRIALRVVMVVTWAVLPGRSALAQARGRLHLYAPEDTTRARDANGFLLDPAWIGDSIPKISRRCGFRAVPGALNERVLVTRDSLCLSAEERRIVTLNEPRGLLIFGFVCSTNSQLGDVRGHVNWFPITATGRLRGADFADGTNADRDLSIDFYTKQPNASTTGNDPDSQGNRGYHIEFFYEETLDYLWDTVPHPRGWWELLNDSLGNHRGMSGTVDDRLAIVTGLFGLDGVHSFQAELHPVYMMAVLTDTATHNGLFRERWAVMVRDRGTEGDCAAGSLPMVTGRGRNQHFVLDLGAWTGASVPRVSFGPGWVSDSLGLPRTRVNGQHTYIDFPYVRPAPDVPMYLFLGTINLEWSSRGENPSVSRFAGRVPGGIAGLNLNTAVSESLSFTKRRPPERRSGTPGSNLLKGLNQRDSLDPKRAHGVELHDGATVPPTDSAWTLPHAETSGPTLPQAIHVPVEGVCPPSDRVCLSPLRLLAGSTLIPPQRWFLGAFILPHGANIPSWGGIGDFLNGLGYRLEVRSDRFRPDCPGCATDVNELSVIASAAVVSSSVDLGPVASVSPYLITGLGPSFSRHQPVHVRWDVGGGFAITALGVPGIFIELLNHGRSGAFFNHWELSAGYSLGF